jgi:arylsulfatase A-like enzyme/Tfp pilus assembly protein PilF
MIRSDLDKPEGLRYTRSGVVQSFSFALAVALCAGLVFAQAPRPNVLLVTIDTVRADHIGAYGYAKGSTPVLDRLAREGVRFADATTQAPLTGPAHAAILTGMYPARYGVRDNATTPIPPSVTTMAEIFKSAGYRTGGFVGAFILSAPYGFGQGFDAFDADFSGYTDGMKLQVQRRCQAVTDAALKWVAPAGAQPFFAWVHLYDAHAPYDAPAPYSQRFKAAPYDGEVAYVDACIGRLVQALEQTGRLDRTVVSVVADHGESLGEHGEQEHGLFLYEPVLRVPWIMRLPGRQHAGITVNEQVRTIDVLPTLTALAGILPPPKTDGKSAVPLLDGKAHGDPAPSYAETFYPKWHYGWSELRSVRVGAWKYVDAPHPELYDMRSDKAELKNAIGARGALANGLSSEIGKIVGTFGAAATIEAPQPDPETLARLRSLGYVGIAAPSSGARGADPKDMVAKAEAFRLQLSRAMDALSRNQTTAAITQLKQLMTINDRSYELHLFLGDAYAATRDFERALGEYATAGVLNPNSAAPELSSARAYLEQGDSRRAVRKTDEAASVEPGNAGVPLVRGMILEQQGQPRQALAQYAAAVHANGSDPTSRARLASLAMRLKEFDQAEPQFQALLRLGYRPSRMHFGLGQVAEAKGDAARAIAEYRETIKLEPSFAEARNALTRLTR